MNTNSINYGAIYQLGYRDALEGLKRHLQFLYLRTDMTHPGLYSFNSGWNAAIDKLVTDSINWDIGTGGV